jgi:hypothetical protein
MALISPREQEFRAIYRGYDILVSFSGTCSFSAHPRKSDLPILACTSFMSLSSGAGAIAEAEKRIDRVLACALAS